MKNTTMLIIGGGLGLAAYLLFIRKGGCTDCNGKNAAAPASTSAGAPPRVFQRDPGFGAGVAGANIASRPAAPAAGAGPAAGTIKPMSPSTAALSPTLAAGSKLTIKRNPYQSPPILPEPGPRGPGPIYGAQPY